jgi:putative endonuclease
MFYVYILRSKKDKRLYIGYTSDLRKRFQEHNSGLNKSTKNRVPFSLIYYEAYRSIDDAKIREQRLKHFQNSYKELRKRLKHSLDEA